MRISTCMAVYNGGQYITEMLESVLKQLSKEDEVIISDDCSTDDTLNKVRAFQDKRIKIYQNEQNLGYTKNFENALMHARGRYIFLADQDDVWISGKVDACLDALQSKDFVVTDALVCDEALRCTAKSHTALAGSRTGFIYNWMRTRYIGACMAFRKEVLDKAMPFPQNQMYCAHDYWIACIAELYFKTEMINQPYLKYRRHTSNASGGGINKSEASMSFKVLKRIYTLKELLKRK